MTKITYAVETYMKASITNLFNRVIAARPCPIDPHSLHEMCTTQADRATMARAFTLAGFKKNEIFTKQEAVVPLKGLQVPLTGPRIPNVPQEIAEKGEVVLDISYPQGIHGYLIKFFNPSLAAEQEIAPFMDWLQWRIEYGLAFALAEEIVDHFRLKGGSVEQLRYAMPGTLTLCTTHEPLHYLVPRIERFRAPAKPFPLPSDLLRKIKVVNEVLAVAALMPESSKSHNITLTKLNLPGYALGIK